MRIEPVLGAVWRGPPELGSSRPSPPGLVQGFPRVVFPLVCFVWFSFVGVREVLNSVLSFSKEPEHTPELVALTFS